MAYGLPGQFVTPGSSEGVDGLIAIFQASRARRAQEDAAKQRESELTRRREYEIQDRDFEAQQNREQAKAQFDAKRAEAQQKTDAEASKKRDELTGVLQSQWASQLQRSPDLAPGLQRHADMLAKAGKINPIQLPGFGERPVAPGLQGPPALGADPQQMAQFQAEAQAGATMRGEKPPAGQDPSDLAQKVEEAFGFPRGTPEHQREMQKLMAKQGGGININLPGGNAEIEKGVRAKFQESQAGDEMLLAKIDDIRSYGDPSRFLGLKSQVKNFALSKIAGVDGDLLSPESQQLVSDARLFKEDVESTYLQSKVAITGASGGQQELREIRNAVLSTDMSSPEFQASLDKLERVTRRNMDIRSRLLREGLDLKSTGGRKRLSDEIDRARASEASKSNEAAIEAALAKEFGP
jgi:hypothetical protein